MADNIKSTGGKPHPSTGKIPEESGLPSVKKANAKGPEKIAEGFSHVTEASSQKGEKPIFGEKPMLAMPANLEKKEIDQICNTIENKITEPKTTLEVLKSVSVGSDFQTRIDKTTKDINAVLSSKDSFASKTTQIQMILLSTMNITLEIGGEYGKSIAIKQAEEQNQAAEIRKKEEAAQKKSGIAALFQKIFGWIGDIFNLIAATVTFVATVIAAVGTAGASTPAIVGASLWIGAAVIGLVFRGLNESETIKAAIPQGAAIFVTVSVAALSIGGMALTGGASAAFQAGTASTAFQATQTAQAAWNMIPTAINYITRATLILKVTGEGATKIASAKFQEQIGLLEADKIQSEQVQQQLDYIINNLNRRLNNVVQSTKDLSDVISSDFAKVMRTIGAISTNTAV